MKKRLCLILFFLFPKLFATSFFSGDFGLMANFINKKNFGIDPALTFTGFLGGQLALSQSLSLDGEFSLQTDDLYENGFSKEAYAVFRVNEISMTYSKSFAGATHTFTFFKGFNEPIGSQKFITRRLGVENFSSYISSNYLGQNGLNAYEVFGTGGSYSLTMKSIPMSLGLVVSKNRENDEDVSQLCTDIRLAYSSKIMSIDFLAGLGAPLYTKNSSNEDVVLLIDTLYLHSGIDFLLGNKYSPASLFLQCGFDHLSIKKGDKSKDFEPENTSLILEPRFKLGDARLYITAFNFPDEKTGKAILIDDTCGLNIAMFAETMYKKGRNYSAGIHCMASFEGKHLNDYSDSDFMEVMNVKFCPFAEIDADKGKLNFMLQANLTKFADSKPEAFKFHIGYKKGF
ncbi:MAG: hypothetical protein IJ727_04895 [Treponema sp.]|nr:hypothetical protein [Treponema sp.]